MKGPSPFYSSLLLLVLLNLVIKPVWILGIDRQVQNTVGLYEYGNYFSLLNLSITCNFLLDWGLTSYYNRQLASDHKNFKNYAGHFLLIKFLFVGVYALIVFTIAWITGVTSPILVGGLILLQVFTSLFVFLRAVITAGQLFKTDAWLSILDKSLMILLCGNLLLFPQLFGYISIEKFLFLQVACMAFAVVVTAVILARHQFFFKLPAIKLDVLNTLKPVLPYALVLLFMSLHYRLDGFLLERMRPDGAFQAGVYASAYRLLDASSMIGYLFATFLLPFVARQSSEQNDIKAVILSTRHLLITFGIGIACTAAFMAPWLNNILYGHTDAESTAVLQWCLPAVIGYSLVHIYGTVLTATGHIKSFCIINVIAVVLNVLLNLALIPSLGAKGCCIAALASQWLCGLICMFYVKEKLNVPVQAGSLFIYIFIAGVIAAVFYLGGRASVGNGLLLTIAAIATISVLIISGLFKPAAWIQLITKKQPAS